MIEYHRLGGLSNRGLFPLSSGGWMSKMKVWAELVFSEPLSLALPMPVFSVRLHVVFSRCVRVLISS